MCTVAQQHDKQVLQSKHHTLLTLVYGVSEALFSFRLHSFPHLASLPADSHTIGDDAQENPGRWYPRYSVPIMQVILALSGRMLAAGPGRDCKVK